MHKGHVMINGVLQDYHYIEYPMMLGDRLIKSPEELPYRNIQTLGPDMKPIKKENGNKKKPLQE